MPEALMTFFRDAKLGGRDEENQDNGGYAEDPARGRATCAVADGATGGYESADWATRLVASFLELEPGGPQSFAADHVDQWVGRMQESWRVDPPRAPSGPYAIYAERLEREGSLATFLGCDINGLLDGQVRWSAMAVGDCVLFHVRDRTVLQHFPPLEPGQFTLNPVGVSTRAELRQWTREGLQTRRKQPMEVGDFLFIASDALAEWMLKASSPELWDELATLDHPDVFIDRTRRCRREKAMDDDDVTLLRVEIARRTDEVRVAQ